MIPEMTPDGHVETLRTLHRIGEAGGVPCYAGSNVAQEFSLAVRDGGLCVTPKTTAAYQRSLRPIAHFRVQTQPGDYPELNLMMGMISFPGGDTSTKCYRPFSRDKARAAAGLYVGVHSRLGDDPGYFNAVFRHFADAIPAQGIGPALERYGSIDVDTWARRFQQLHSHTYGRTHLVELHLLDLMVRASATNDRHVIEIGPYQGRSTAAIAAALGDCGVNSLLFSIDPNEFAPQAADVALANVAAVGQRRRLVQIHRPTAAVTGIWTEGMASMAFIDGSHEFADMLTDYNLCDRLLMPGGILVLHDIFPARHVGYEPMFPDPPRLLEEVVLPSDRYRPIAAAHQTVALRKLHGPNP